jgi:phospholipid-transporting ATPase
MVKTRYPEKSTLAIGDGANDVAMIMKADVGVGIKGREGMQAARSADYSIGQFKFLKTLMFFHGRECYRRNSDLVCYTFYKNMLYVLAQFWFGFNSVFSGQTLYEPFIYQLFNITYTGLPIMWYALFDFQHEKQQFLAKGNAFYYKVGIENKFFGNLIFWKWILYGLVQALMIYIFGFYCNQTTAVNSSGLDFNFWPAG